MNNILIYTASAGKRQAYVFDFIFNEIFGLTYHVCTSVEDFDKSNSFRINYSESDLNADLQILPHALLTEEVIRPQEIVPVQWQGLPVFFQNNNPEWPFDIFSAVFYLLTRYEEYLPYKPDQYERYPHTASLAYAHRFLNIPLIDLWLKQLKALLSAKNEALLFKPHLFRFLPTYDIDIAYSYAGKGISRTLGGGFKALMKGDLESLKERREVLGQTRKDPYDSYAYLDRLHAKHRLKPVYFFLLGNNGPLDKNIPFGHALMQQLYHDISSKYETGVHPSYGSHDGIDILQSEIEKIRTAKSRQHYIRFRLPVTYRNLISAGIKEDYSMGYGSINGFRAGTSFPFYWFDVERNEQTALRIFPFCYMECNSFFEQKLDAQEALEEMLHYLKQVKNVGGLLITIWHNFSLGSDKLWTGWKESYERFLEHI